MIEIIPIKGVPIVLPGDDILEIIYHAIEENNIKVKNYDIFIIAHKIISRAKGGVIKLSDVKPTDKAIKLSKILKQDPKKIQVILNQSKKIIKVSSKHLITESKLGFICANSGVDRSNSYIDDSLVTLPDESDKISDEIRCFLEEKYGCKLGIIISDTHGRALRKGAVGIAIGVSGIPALVSFKGRKDIFGYTLKATDIAVADELASAAQLVMGEADEKIPIVLIRGVNLPKEEGGAKHLIYKKEEALFY
ncbi:MAG: coenzyme F420-0:L-glutamate ligase [Candidatus Odinarchaeia archaeon]